MECPAHYEDKARAAQEAGDWHEAAKQWYLARTASVGHNRRDRYERLAKRCEDKAREVDNATGV